MTDDRVRTVRIEGVESFDEAEVLDALATQENQFNPFTPPSTYNRFDVAADVQRIETFYHGRGYFDADVVSHDVSIRQGRRRDSATVTFVVEEGSPTFLASDATYRLDTARGIDDISQLVGSSRLRRGTVFSQVEVESERVRLQRALQERSYARASIISRVYVERETKSAQVFFFFDPGVSCLFGDVIIEGHDRIPAELISDVVPIRTGRQFRQSLLRVSQIELYDMDVFTSVEVVADLSESAPSARLHAEAAAWDTEMAMAGFERLPPPWEDANERARVTSLLDNLGEIEAVDPNIPVTIRVAESASARYRAGGGLGIETSRTAAYGRANAVWRNVGNPLNRIELETRLGYTWIPSVFRRTPFPSGIVGHAELGLSRPKVLFGIFDAALRLGFEHGLEPSYSFDRLSLRLGMSNRIGEFLVFSASYKISLNYTTDFAEFALLERTDSCDRLPSTFRLGHIDVSLRSDRRDPNLLRGRADWAGEVNAQLGEAVAGQYPYARLQPDLRYYQPLTRRLSIATRVGAGVIFDYGAPVPRSQCLFLGGGTTVRGFPARRVGPHVEPGLPGGGVLSAVFNFEPRLRLSDLFGLVAFFDAGTVNSRLSLDPTWGSPTGIQASVGAGLRVFTPVGPFRFDVAGRLSDPGSSVGRLQRFGFVLSLGEAF